MAETVTEDGRSLEWAAGLAAALPAGALLGSRRPGRQLTLTALDGEPELADELVAALGATYDTEVGEVYLPVPARTWCSGAGQTGRLHRPAPAVRARRGNRPAGTGQRYARDESVWRHAAAIDRARRIGDQPPPAPRPGPRHIRSPDEGPLATRSRARSCTRSPIGGADVVLDDWTGPTTRDRLTRSRR